MHAADLSKRKRERLVQICPSDRTFEWLHALATILVIEEKAITGGLTASEQAQIWQNHMQTLKQVPWIVAPITKAETKQKTTWEEAMTARVMVSASGLLTISLGQGGDLQGAAISHWLLRSH